MYNRKADLSDCKQNGAEPGMSQPQTLLINRTERALLSLFCLVESVWSWASIARGIGYRVDLVTALFSLLLVFIVGSIAYRSSFWGDRVVFSAIAGVFALAVVRAAPFPPTAMLALDVAHAFAWTIAALMSLIILARTFGALRRFL